MQNADAECDHVESRVADESEDQAGSGVQESEDQAGSGVHTPEWTGTTRNSTKS